MGKPRTMDKLQGLSGGASVSSSFLSQPIKVENLDYQQGYDGGAGYGGYGYDQSAGDQLGAGYSDGYGYEDQSAYGTQSGWGYDESGEFGGTQQVHFSRGGRATTGAPAKEGVAGVRVSRGVAEGVRATAGSRAKWRASPSAGGVVIRTPGEGGEVKAQAEVKGSLSVKGTKVSGGGAEVKGVNPGAAARAAVPPLLRNRGAAVAGT